MNSTPKSIQRTSPTSRAKSPSPHALKPKSPAKRRASKTTDDDFFGKHKPDPHQVKSLAHAECNNRVLDFSDPGTGKTPVAIWAYAKRRRNGEAKCALVISPRTLCTNVWQASFRKFAPYLTTSVATAKNRAEAFMEDADAYITNTDAAVWLAKQKPKFFDRFSDLIIDESSGYKHPTSARSKAIAKIRKYFDYRRLLSGTPATRSITDVWHQALICDDGKRLGTSFYAFRNSVCVPEQRGRHQHAVEWVDKEGAEEAVFGLLEDITVRHVFEDVVKIPERLVYTVDYIMEPKHAKAYFEMEKNQLLIYEKAKAKGTITAINSAVVRGKLLQIASGAVYADGDESNGRPTHTLDTGRYELTMDMAEESPHALVMFLWQHQRDALVAEAEKRKLTYAVLDGNASDQLRNEVEQRYQNGLYDVLIAHPKTVAHGLTLTRGSLTIWASPTDDTEWFKQGARRQARRGQDKKTRVVTLVAPGTFDEHAYANCQTKGKREDALLSLFAERTKD